MREVVRSKERRASDEANAVSFLLVLHFFVLVLKELMLECILNFVNLELSKKNMLAWYDLQLTTRRLVSIS